MSDIFAKKATTDTAASNADLLGMLQLLSNPEKFKEQMAVLEEKERVCNEKIALAGKAEEIVSLHAATKAMKSEAEELLISAATEVSIKVTDAQKQADHLLKEAHSEALLIVDAAKKEATSIELLSKKEVASADEALAVRMKIVAQREKDLEDAELELASFKLSRADYLLAKEDYQKRLKLVDDAVAAFALELNNL